mmetsp:Transcript_176/g.302  ORF Transcript_176/g.302 Transcript_176/m.302 type:complete len:296 (-) Transcript_176:1401-2288(-)
MKKMKEQLHKKAASAYMDDDTIKEVEKDWYKVPQITDSSDEGENEDFDDDDVLMLEEIDQALTEFDEATQQESYEKPENEVTNMINLFEGIINDNLEKQSGITTKSSQTPSDWEQENQEDSEDDDDNQESFIQLFPLLLLIFLTIHDGLLCTIFLVKPIYWFRLFHGVGHSHFNFVYRAMAYYATTFIIQGYTIYKTQQNIPKISPIVSYKHRQALEAAGQLETVEKSIKAYQAHLKSKEFFYLVIGSMRLADVLTHGAYFYASSSLTLAGRIYLSFAGHIFGYIAYYFISWKSK